MVTKEQLYSDARTYYNTHIQPHFMEPASNDSKVLAIRNTLQASRSNSNFNKPTDDRNYRNYRDNNNYNNYRNNNRNDNRNSNRNNYRDPRSHIASSSTNLWCDYHRRPGGRGTFDCKAKFMGAEYMLFQEQQRSQQQPPNYDPPLVYTTTTPEAHVNTKRVYKTTPPTSKLWIYEIACLNHDQRILVLL